MFIGRKSELKFMQEQYQSEEHNFVILYGRSGIGKTRLLQQFITIGSSHGKGKPMLYYCAREASEREQFLQMKREWLQDETEEEPDYETLFRRVMKQRLPEDGQKLVVVIDEYHRMQRGRSQILAGLQYLLEDSSIKNRLMVLLISSSVVWAENQMVRSLGLLATQITAFMKLKEFTFLEMVTRFPDASVEEVIGIYAILGGVPGYLALWDEKHSFAENVKRLCLMREGVLYREPIHYLKQTLRELGDYSSILATLATRKWKLNLLHHRTGFNRPKVSVYIKNLIQMDVAEKVFSYDELSHENSQKGLYTIRENYIEFWYRFVYPNLSLLELGQVSQVYDQVIAPGLDDYMHECYVKVCKEYLAYMNQYKKLPFVYTSCGSWYGKAGTLDMIALNHTETRRKPEALVAQCKWSSEPLHRDDYENLLYVMEQAGVSADHLYIFSKSGFDAECKQLAGMSKQLVLVDLDSL